MGLSGAAQNSRSARNPKLARAGRCRRRTKFRVPSAHRRIHLRHFHKKLIYMAEKQLECTVAASEHQKAWFAGLRRDVFENRKPYAIVQADMPLELFQAMDVPVVSNQWWAAIISAKRLSPVYLDSMNARGFHEGLCRYCSLPLASTLGGDVAVPPWGGLPRPALIAARLTCDCIQRVFAIWSEALGTEFIALDAPGASELPPRWWELSRYRWRELFEEH